MQTQQSKKQIHFQRNQKERNEEIVKISKNEKKKSKTRSYPNSSIDITGNIQSKIDLHNKI